MKWEARNHTNTKVWSTRWLTVVCNLQLNTPLLYIQLLPSVWSKRLDADNRYNSNLCTVLPMFVNSSAHLISAVQLIKVTKVLSMSVSNIAFYLPSSASLSPKSAKHSRKGIDQRTVLLKYIMQMTLLIYKKYLEEYTCFSSLVM